jgi:microcystin-dependent protein
MANTTPIRPGTLPVRDTVTPNDTILVVNDAVPPDIERASIEAVAVLASTQPAAKGEKGAPGDEGPQGPKGDALAITGVVDTEADLAALTVEVGDTYVTADTGELWVWSGTAWVLIATAVGPEGPQGIQGAPGAQGIQGEKGEKGDPGVGIPGASVPTGTILDFAGTTAPAGFLICDGKEYNDVDYPDLAALLRNTPWSTGVAVGKFKVPNLSNRVTVGVGAAPFGVVGQTVGSKDAVVVAHRHPAGGLGVDGHRHGVNIGTTDDAPDHAHAIDQHAHTITDTWHWVAGAYGLAFEGPNGAQKANRDQPYNTSVGGPTGTHGANTRHRHSVNGSSDLAGATVSGETANPTDGVAGTDRNVQPSAVVTKIIKT